MCRWQYITSGLITDNWDATRTNSSGAVAIPKGRAVNWKERPMTRCILSPTKKQWRITSSTWDRGRTRLIDVTRLPIHLHKWSTDYLAVPTSKLGSCDVLINTLPSQVTNVLKTVGLYTFYWDYKCAEAYFMHTSSIKVVVSCQNIYPLWIVWIVDNSVT